MKFHVTKHSIVLPSLLASSMEKSILPALPTRVPSSSSFAVNVTSQQMRKRSRGVSNSLTTEDVDQSISRSGSSLNTISEAAVPRLHLTEPTPTFELPPSLDRYMDPHMLHPHSLVPVVSHKNEYDNSVASTSLEYLNRIRRVLPPCTHLRAPASAGWTQWQPTCSRLHHIL